MVVVVEHRVAGPAGWAGRNKNADNRFAQAKAVFYFSACRQPESLLGGLISHYGKGLVRVVKPDGVCLEHSGTCEAIKTLKRNDADVFDRLREIEKTVYKAAAYSSLTTAILVTILEKVIK